MSVPAVAAAARRILALLGPTDVLAQLCREAAALAGGARALASYVGPSQQWNEGLHVASDDAVTPATRSALYAVYRRLCMERELVVLEDPPFADAAVVTGLPILRRGGRVGGALVVAGPARLDGEALDQLRFLCESASTALDNALRYAAAKRDQDRLFRFSEASDEAIWEWQPDTDAVWWGGGIQKILAGSGLEVVPTMAWKTGRIHEDDRGGAQASFEHALASPASAWRSTYRFRRADGSYAVVEDRAYFLRDEKGHAFRVVGHLRDVTELEGALAERRRAEDALRSERAVFRSVFMNAPASICVLRGPDHVFELANPPYRALLGDRPIEGLPVREAVPELADQGYLEILDRVYRTGEPFFGNEMGSRLRQPDGTLAEVFFNFVYEPMPGPDGRPDGIIAFGFDVTPQVVARRRLEAALKLTDTITSNATLGLLMMDARQHCTFMNPAAERITGFTLDEVQGKPLHDFIHYKRPDGTPYPMAECPIDRALPTQNQQAGEDVFIHRDGHFYPVAFTASPILQDGKPVGTVIELRDTTEEKAAQAERERILGDLRAAVAARDEFLAIASHELKTPLTPLRLQLDGLIARLRKSSLDDQNVWKKLDLAIRQTERIAKLVENLLDVSRITRGRLVLEREEVDLAELAAEVVERFQDEARRAGCKIELTVAAGVVGRWDRVRVEQLVDNLITNAIKYGAGKPIEVRIGRRDGRAELVVRDHGIGIRGEDIDRIFGRFERAVSIRHYGGLGLGLYIARQIAEAHGGQIAVESQPGEGSTFTVFLPLAR